jgi:hypothetical protein
MYRKFENAIHPKTKILISRNGKELFEPPKQGDTVTFKVTDHIYFGVLVEFIDGSSIKGEIITIGGVKFPDSQDDSYKDWNLGEKIEFSIEKIDGIIKK